jgi:DNA repair protein RadA/Sms
MNKIKSVYSCQNCGSQSPKWVGKCSSCNEWNTFVEEVITIEQPKNSLVKKTKNSAHLINEVPSQNNKRITFIDNEFNRVLGGGLVSGSVVLLAGEPGIGKSTLTLKLALALKKTVLYVSGEESAEQIKMRAQRLNIESDSCYIFNETQISSIFIQADKLNPELIIIDSIQTSNVEYIDSSPGSVSQIKECTSQLIKYAKTKAIPIIIIGHITKEGSIAGPKVLEHMVDTVLHFEGDKNFLFRIIRSIKNRFGNTSELGIYEMSEKGLIEVINPSQVLNSENKEQLSGVTIGCMIEGNRPIMIEVQALTSPATYGNPQRSATGYDLRRLNMLLAVLEKRGGLKLNQKDVFLNITGGIKLIDPAADLSIISAILSSNFDLCISSKTCFSGEVGLSGEIRPVSRVNQRIKEAEKLGMEKIFISKYSKIEATHTYKIKVIKIGKVQELVQYLFK